VLAGKRTEQEKIQAIHQFVLRNTHYVALEFGVYGYKPYAVSQVYARRFGDCKDKASLMIALLRATGIEADIALVRTRRLGDIGERATSISIFNHAVVYVPKYDLWLDGTAEYAGSRELPLEDQGAMALTVARDGEAQLRRIPVTLPMENYTHRLVQARILPDGKIEFTGSAYTRGEDAPGLRREYEVAERQRDSVRNRLAEVLPSVRVDIVQVYGANDLERDVTVKFSGEVEMFAGRPSLNLATSWMPRSYIQKLAPLPSRGQDLLLPAPWTTEEELHFALPAGARLDSVPPDKTLETPFGMAVLRYQRQGGELVVTTSVQFRKLRILPSEYRAFRDFCTQVESAFRAEIKVGLKG
jgi:cellulose synthase operon protein C